MFNVPKLRFGEFEGEWVEKPIENILKIGSGKDYKHLEKGVIPVYGTGGYMTSVNNYLYDGESVCIGRKGTIDKPRFVNGKFWTVDTLFFTHSWNNSVPKFVYSLFQKVNWKKYNEASGVPSLSKKTIEKIKINIPSLEEQKKIATFLTSIDKKIEQLNQKSTLLESYKKGVMQKIFSQEIRFKRDDGGVFEDWVEKRLGKISTLTSSKRVYLSDYVKIGVPFYRGKEISELKLGIIPKDILYISEERYEEYKLKYGVPMVNDLLITAVGTLCNVLKITDNKPFYFKDGNLIWIKNIEENSSFLEILLHIYKRDIEKTSIGSTQRALTMVELRKIKLPFPQLEEQQKISNFLTSIDQKITQNNQALEEMKAFKKGLLQQMFV
jgi:restriction endonuclease S subunit